MAINVESAFDVDQDGVAIRDNDGNVLFYMATGSGAPTGAAPINTWYFRQDTNTVYYKFGALDTDWRQIRGADITYDNSVVNLSAANLQEAIEKSQGTSGLPLSILNNETFEVPDNKQVVLAEITVETGGLLINDGLVTII